MTIYPICTTMMKYRIIQTLAEAYYRYRVKNHVSSCGRITAGPL